MISEQAKQGLDFIFTKAARSHLILDAADAIEIQQLPGGELAEPPEKQIVVLTIASFLFRLLTIFHVNADPATSGYYTRGAAERSFLDEFPEVGNLCCGAMNRDLGNHFAHLGMSTPYLLESKCLPFLAELKPSYVSRHRIQINQSVNLHATLCLCAYAPLDFRVDRRVAEEETGALELF